MDGSAGTGVRGKWNRKGWREGEGMRVEKDRGRKQMHDIQDRLSQWYWVQRSLPWSTEIEYGQSVTSLLNCLNIHFTISQPYFISLLHALKYRT